MDAQLLQQKRKSNPRLIQVKYGQKSMDLKVEPGNLKKWQNNTKMFTKIRKSIKAEFALPFDFSLYDPHGELYVDDMDDLSGCFLGHEMHSDFVLSLDVHSPEQQHDRKSSLLDLSQEINIKAIVPTNPVDHNRTIQILDNMLRGYPSKDLEPDSDDVYAVSLILKSRPNTWSVVVQQLLSTKNRVLINIGDFQQSLLYRMDHEDHLVDGSTFHSEMSDKSTVFIENGSGSKKGTAFWGYRVFRDLLMVNGSLRFSLFLKMCPELKTLIVFHEEFGAFYDSISLEDQFVTEILTAIEMVEQKEDGQSGDEQFGDEQLVNGNALFREFVIVDPEDAIYQFIEQNEGRFKEKGWSLGLKMYKNPTIRDGHSRPSLWIHRALDSKEDKD